MKLSDTVVGAGFVAAGAFIVAATLTYPSMEGGQPGPALFPRIVGGLMAGFGALLALSGIRRRDVSQRVAWRALLGNPAFVNALFVIGGVVAYIALADTLGFLLTAALVVFLLMWRLGVPPLRAVLVAVPFTVAVYALFAKLLRVPLPTGLVWW